MKPQILSQLLTLSVTLTRAQPSRLSHTVNGFYSAVIQAVKACINADAVALLINQNDTLIPVALEGLTRDTFGRRFELTAHPRLAAISHSRGSLRFDEHCDLPDPYDGLLLANDGDLPVHSCMGLALFDEQELMAIITLDSLTPGSFAKYSESFLQHVNDIVTEQLKCALYNEQLLRKAQHGHALVSELSQATHDMVGQSGAMQSLKSDIQLVASSDFSVLIQGETGTGKELVARNIHKYSRRADQAFVQVNCASLPENLAESEFFGHRKGAFTGADKNREGKFMLADGGTIFLDEIGELPLSIQSKLLRVLQNGEIQPVGADQTEQVNVRVIAATNRNLEQEIAQGRFRADLYHRLSVYPINVPPLKARRDDILLLAGFFVEQVRKKLALKQLTLNSKLENLLVEYEWPGNIRELEHVISRSALRAKQAQWPADIISIEPKYCELQDSKRGQNIAQPTSATLSNRKPLKQAVEDFQRVEIIAALEENDLNWSGAARQLELDRANLVRLAKRLNIHVKKHL
ncbi:nitric oxide reductase transcriptional regulator NorR [Pseudoalteromonas sp. S16_S37]|uniref:nitric oxide reductase transcriptional regulator NorR n=1 Tax=Pseudoalteromonas sp. S16_S37 TaxID=2720228 RepID=UPI001680D333|nr:nitric oxide reductase transcriptional regulator NorR [Pseudoalteromonas sp. S16_S37]MBD1582991.1 nitric oxide reductase transcriptional regulator NorR [Pseudoalteromonas sp. S16_S37]